MDLGGEVFKIVPRLPILEVSGPNAAPLRISASGGWTWEDLAGSSSHPVAGYKVYRSDGGPAGPFQCVRLAGVPAWPEGDAAVPPAGQAFYYLVTGFNAAGAETRPGNRSDGTLRTVDTASLCPP